MLKKITSNSVTPGVLPFFEEALEKGIVQPEQPYEIRSVSESRKRSGYILKSDQFMIFIWKSDPICDIMLETLVELTNLHPSHALCVLLDLETVEGFSLCIDDSIARMWTRTKKLRILDLWTSRSATKSGEKELLTTMKRK